MATQKRPISNKENAKASADRTVEGIFDEDYQSRAYDPAIGSNVPAGIDGDGASDGQVWTADEADGADWASIVNLSSAWSSLGFWEDLEPSVPYIEVDCQSINATFAFIWLDMQETFGSAGLVQIKSDEIMVPRMNITFAPNQQIQIMVAIPLTSGKLYFRTGGAGSGFYIDMYLLGLL